MKGNKLDKEERNSAVRLAAGGLGGRMNIRNYAKNEVSQSPFPPSTTPPVLYAPATTQPATTPPPPPVPPLIDVPPLRTFQTASNEKAQTLTTETGLQRTKIRRSNEVIKKNSQDKVRNEKEGSDPDNKEKEKERLEKERLEKEKTQQAQTPTPPSNATSGTSTPNSGGSGNATTDEGAAPKRKKSSRRTRKRVGEGGLIVEEEECLSERIGAFLNDVSQRAKRTVRFLSRPVSENALRRWVTKVQERKAKHSVRELGPGMEAFPSRNAIKADRMKLSEEKRPKNSFNNDHVIKDIFADPPILKSGNTPVSGNKNNDGKLFNDDGRPFWMSKKKGVVETPTEDDLPMNADVVFDVQMGKIKIVAMPTIPVKLDPWETQEKMQQKDAQFFTKDVLFGNTIRTMINPTEMLAPSEKSETSQRSQRRGKSKDRKSDGGKVKNIKIKEPHNQKRYSPDLLAIRKMNYKRTEEDKK